MQHPQHTIAQRHCRGPHGPQDPQGPHMGPSRRTTVLIPTRTAAHDDARPRALPLIPRA